MPEPDVVKSDDLLLDVIESLKENESVGVTELAEDLGVAKSTVHAHLTTLRQRGFAVRCDGGSYRISLQFLELGTIARNTQPVYHAAAEKVRSLADETGERIWLVAEENGKAVALASAGGQNAIRTNVQVGQHTELYALAGGRAILANLPTDRRDEILDCYDFPLYNDGTGRAAFVEELEAIEDRGIAVVADVFIKSVTSIGAPIVDNGGQVHGALSISGPKERLKRDATRPEYIDLLSGVTNEIGINLSYK